MKLYRYVTIDAEGIIHGEYRVIGPNDFGWVQFSGRPDLMKIAHAWETAPTEVAMRIWAASDGYGEPGTIPAQGYDWSGIRDSSPEAIARMERIAVQWYNFDGQYSENRLPWNLWPWETGVATAAKPSNSQT